MFFTNYINLVMDNNLQTKNIYPTKKKKPSFEIKANILWSVIYWINTSSLLYT